MPVLVQELLTLYAHKGDDGGAAAGDAVPRLSGLDRGAGSRRRDCGLAGGFGRAGRADACGAARSRAGAGGTRADHACAERDAHRGADPAGARAGSDAQHLHPGRVGDPARASDRARRRGVRRDGGGPAAGDCRHRDAWWGCSSTRCRCASSCRPASRCVDLLHGECRTASRA